MIYWRYFLTVENEIRRLLSPGADTAWQHVSRRDGVPTEYQTVPGGERALKKQEKERVRALYRSVHLYDDLASKARLVEEDRALDRESWL